jgi:hypothetical protein
LSENQKIMISEVACMYVMIPREVSRLAYIAEATTNQNEHNKKFAGQCSKSTEGTFDFLTCRATGWEKNQTLQRLHQTQSVLFLLFRSILIRIFAK